MFLSAIDFIAPRITLYHNNLLNHSSNSSIILSFVTIIVIIVFSIIFSLDFVFHKNPTSFYYKKYINGKLIQCSYEKKRRFLSFFLAGICPLGLDYFYLGHYYIFIIIFIIAIIIFILNIISFILNYKINKKNEEIKRQQKLKKANKKFIISNITEINDKCVNSFSKATNVLTVLLLIYWIVNFIMQGIGHISDVNNVPTENDMGYLFESPEY